MSVGCCLFRAIIIIIIIITIIIIIIIIIIRFLTAWLWNLEFRLIASGAITVFTLEDACNRRSSPRRRDNGDIFNSTNLHGDSEDVSNFRNHERYPSDFFGWEAMWNNRLLHYFCVSTASPRGRISKKPQKNSRYSVELIAAFVQPMSNPFVDSERSWVCLQMVARYFCHF